ncbi:MAG: type II toxin-antitoxin system prevent-host-death family antitoxin [Dehalococcoidia bacterium]|nr:type II toxin-antitoxin system prevent-host-death family antitoxin [Dehalococcoidia bacterium]
MEEIVSSTNANREFARLLRGVREGRRYTIVSHGQPIAWLVPAMLAGTGESRAALLERLATELPSDVDHWKQDEVRGACS